MSDTFAAARAETFAGTVEGIAATLERTAAEIRRQRRPGPSLDDGLPDFVDSAVIVQHKVLWMVANLNLDGLTRLADETARIHRQEVATDG